MHRQSPDGEMVDALVSGASVERRVGSSPILGTAFIVKRQHLLPFFVLSLMVTYDKYAPTKLKTRALQLLPFDDKSIYRDNDIISVVFLFLL